METSQKTTANRESLERAIAMQTDTIKMYLESIRDKAEAALDRLDRLNTISFVNSDVNGIGSDFTRVTQAIEARATFKQVLDFMFAEEVK